ncbi:outer membrane protein assembly factor BamB family protein [Botrimarina colliarenosi]|uniref:outer membrane protein assembly factor BamB family protein n=1 Tax=Botrimarina colliarenosi TaxID=2528001 RepID=UPI0018D34396|nr:PQQ-binding-like beta-propeller repeat protein [Botrimarina colliarenosi]
MPNEPEVVWTYEAGETSLEATPVIAAGVAYFGDFDGTMHAVRVVDGSLVWKQSFDGSGFVSPAAVAGDALFAPDMNGVVHCLALKDGVERWTFDSESEMYGGPLVHKLVSGDSMVLLPTEGGTLYALDAATGKELWSFAIDAPLRCTPTVVGGHALLAGCDAKLHTLDVETGQETGAVELGDPTGNTAAVVGGVAYFGTEGGSFEAVDANDPAKPVVKWSYRDRRSSQGIRTAAAVTKDAVVYANQGKLVVALRPENGDVLWQWRTRSRVDAAPLSIKDGRILAATTRGRLLLIDPVKGNPVWNYEVGGSFIGAPAAADGVVLLPNTDGRLYAIGGKED